MQKLRIFAEILLLFILLAVGIYYIEQPNPPPQMTWLMSLGGILGLILLWILHRR